jgi:hypothetical protein
MIGTTSATGRTVDDPVRAEAIVTYERARAAMTAAGTGSFTQISHSNLEDGRVESTFIGSYDLAGRTWSARYRTSTTSPRIRREQPEWRHRSLRYRAGGGRYYCSSADWPAAQRGRWRSWPAPATDFLQLVPGEPKGLTPPILRALLRISPTSADADVDGNGWIVHGTVSVPVAVAALDVAADYQAAHVDVAALTGTVDVVLIVDSDLRPSVMSIDGSTLRLTSALPERLRAMLWYRDTSVELSRLHQEVHIDLPDASELLTPEESAEVDEPDPLA